MKRKTVGLLFGSLALAFGALSFSITLKENNHPEFAVTEAWSLDVKPNVAPSYYSAAEGKTGSQLKSELAKFNKPTSPSYDWSRYEAADEAQDDSNSILCIYTRHNIPKSGHCGSYAWDKWNREHVYTQKNSLLAIQTTTTSLLVKVKLITIVEICHLLKLRIKVVPE